MYTLSVHKNKFRREHLPRHCSPMYTLSVHKNKFRREHLPSGKHKKIRKIKNQILKMYDDNE